MRIFYLALFYFTLCFEVFAGVPSKCIYNQKQFDAVVRRINNGEALCITLHKGQYFLKESLLASSPLTIKGNKAIITCAESYSIKDVERETQTHIVYKLKSPINSFPIFFDDNEDLVSISESVLDEAGVNYLESDIISTGDVGSGSIIKIPIPVNLSYLKNKSFSKAFGYIDSGWGTVDFELHKADDFYFYCKTLNKCATNNYMYDKIAYGKKVRFVIYNAELKPNAIYYDSDFLYVPKNITKVYYLLD